MLKNNQEFAKRRQSLLAAIGPGNMGMILAASEAFRNADTHYPYRQDSDFYYLTGVCEPEAVAQDVHDALIKIVATHARLATTQGEKMLADLAKKGRYQRDVY